MHYNVKHNYLIIVNLIGGCLFAWYQAASNAQANFGSNGTTESLTAGSTTVTAKDLYLKLVAAPVASVVQSSSDGHTYGYSGNTLYEGTNAVTEMYSTINITLGGVYNDADCAVGHAATPDEIAMIPAAGANFQFTIVGGTRTRLTFTNPDDTTSEFAAAFTTIGTASKKTIYGKLTQSNGTPNISLYSDNTRQTDLVLYYSIAGQLDNGADMTGAQVEAAWAAQTPAQQKDGAYDADHPLSETITLAAN